MSKFRDKARAIREAGERERGNFTPDRDSVPGRMYRYWKRESGNSPKQENFCHYWRVVLFWAPGWWLLRKAETRTGITVIGLAVVAVLAWLFAVSDGFRGFAVVMGVVLLTAGVLFALGIGVSKVWNSSWNRYVENTLLILLTAVVVLSVGFAFWAGITEVGFIFLLYALGAATAGGAVIAGVFTLAHFIENKRAYKREQARAARWEYFNEHGEFPSPPVKSRKPGFWSGVGDFLVLIAQIVRVNKWKICPLVTIPEDD